MKIYLLIFSVFHLIRCCCKSFGLKETASSTYFKPFNTYYDLLISALNQLISKILARHWQIIPHAFSLHLLITSIHRLCLDNVEFCGVKADASLLPDCKYNHASLELFVRSGQIALETLCPRTDTFQNQQCDIHTHLMP